MLTARAPRARGSVHTLSYVASKLGARREREAQQFAGIVEQQSWLVIGAKNSIQHTMQALLIPNAYGQEHRPKYLYQTIRSNICTHETQALRAVLASPDRESLRCGGFRARTR